MFYLKPEHKSINFKLLRLANHIAVEGAELNHIRRFVEKVPEPAAEPWYHAWTELANEQLSMAETAQAKGHKVTAREAFLRASGYFRESAFFLDHSLPAKVEAYVRSRDAFHAAIPLLDIRVQHVTVPWQGHELPGYLLLPNGPGPHPGIVFIGGADATKEEVYFIGGRRLVDRGYAVLLMDGPGQGESRLVKGHRAMPYWETLGQPAFDTLAGQTGVDAGRIGLLGISMGGYYGPRMVSSGAPYKCLAVWGSCFDVWEDLYCFYPKIRRNMHGIAHITEAEAEEFYRPFTLTDAAPKIQCPVLVAHSDADAVVSVDSATKFAAALKAPHEVIIWKGSIHCMYDRPAEAIPVIFDWLDDHLQG